MLKLSWSPAVWHARVEGASLDHRDLESDSRLTCCPQVLLYFEPSAVAELSLALQAAYDIILSSGRGKASLHTYSGAGPDEAWLQVDLHHATMNWRVRHNGVQRQLSSSLAETREAYLVILADLLNGKA